MPRLPWEYHGASKSRLLLSISRLPIIVNLARNLVDRLFLFMHHVALERRSR